MEEFLLSLSSSNPTPGGGSAAALSAALSAALLGMFSKLTIGKKGYENLEESFKDIAKSTDRIMKRGMELIHEDAGAFDSLMLAFKLPKGQERTEKIQSATIKASEVPMETMKIGLETLELAAGATEGNKNAISDLGTAIHLARAAIAGAGLNVEINLPGIKDEKIRKKFELELDRILEEEDRLSEKVLEKLEKNWGES